ncbi:hypothetical protein [Neisseria flavescens]|uniref:hypothetical protein n=1 Tax=Neisseria flavescens TaxID=484 RepID=UPI000FFC54BE|nr:hypothetical protein [Neisseria flavescens]
MIAEKMEDKKEGLPKGATLKLLQLGVISKRLRHLNKNSLISKHEALISKQNGISTAQTPSIRRNTTYMEKSDKVV